MNRCVKQGLPGATGPGSRSARRKSMDIRDRTTAASSSKWQFPCRFLLPNMAAPEFAMPISSGPPRSPRSSSPIGSAAGRQICARTRGFSMLAFHGHRAGHSCRWAASCCATVCSYCAENRGASFAQRAAQEPCKPALPGSSPGCGFRRNSLSCRQRRSAVPCRAHAGAPPSARSLSKRECCGQGGRQAPRTRWATGGAGQRVTVREVVLQGSAMSVSQAIVDTGLDSACCRIGFVRLISNPRGPPDPLRW